MGRHKRCVRLAHLREAKIRLLTMPLLVRKPVPSFYLCALALGALLLSSLIAHSMRVANTKAGKPTKTPHKGVPAAKRNTFQVPKLLDFASFKKTFKKTYSSMLEDLVRHKLFLTRAIRSFNSSLKYKSRRSDYYLALNPMSDWTVPEIKRLELIPEPRDARNSSKTLGQIDAVAQSSDSRRQVDLNKVEKDLKQAQDQLAAQLVSRSTSSRGGRRKRAARRRVGNKRSSLSLDQLADRPPNERLPAETEAKVVAAPPSNNPNYEPPEPMSFGVRLPASAKSVVEWARDKGRQGSKSQSGDDQVGWLSRFLSAVFGATGGSEDADAVLSDTLAKCDDDVQITDVEMVDALPDETFVDHGQSHCLNEVQNQANCGSCYAFATVAYLEWLLCIRTDNLIKLSEQYIIDCAPQTELSKHLHGCEGGSPYGTIKFFVKYGADVRANYPYVALQGACPYEPDEDHNKMGYIRVGPEVQREAGVPLEHWEEYIQYAPLLINIGTSGDFLEYGGGVHSAEACCAGVPKEECGRHWVLLIGHGREDGEEYWLIRNSYSAAWGDKGHYKLNKNAKECIRAGQGVFYSTENGVDFDLHYLDINKHRAAEVQGRINNMNRYTG